MRRNRHPNKYRENKNKECMITLALFLVNMLQFIFDRKFHDSWRKKKQQNKNKNKKFPSK